ncbi:MAG TPA: ABC transporter ATP-binding protein, partial [Bdellovibrionota bacterium]|nr:ABC transporter ATP-binding protein [Bdellovibrionota bacterium]
MNAKGLEAYLDVEERESRRIEGGTVRKLASYILKSPAPFAAGCGMLLIGTAATLLEPRLFGYAIDEVIVPKQGHQLLPLTLIFLGVIIVRVAAVIAQGYLFEIVGQRVTQKLRCALFDHLHHLPISVFDKNPAGRLLTRVTNDISALAEMFSAGFVSMIGNALMVVGILAWLLVLDLKLGLIVLATFPALVALSVYFSRKLKIAYRESRSKLSALNAFLAENLLGMKVVQLFNRQEIHLSRFDRVNQWYADAQIGTMRVFAMFQPTITWAQGLAMALVIAVGARAALKSELSLGVLVAFFTYVLAIFQPMREIADKWNTFLSGMSSAERIFSILAWKDEEETYPTLGEAPPMLPIQGRIEFRNVWFAYEGEHWVLKDFSCEMLPGSRIGIVGHTGAGKTTLISLLLRFYQHQRGEILLDGRDIRTYDRATLRKAIGIVQQDVFLFSGSALDNVTFWGTSGADSAEAGKFLERAGRSLTIGADGKPAKLEERASNLSMGERQILAFARAFASDPRIWILDEATA